MSFLYYFSLLELRAVLNFYYKSKCSNAKGGKRQVKNSSFFALKYVYNGYSNYLKVK